jgi:hypothetical protein
MSAASATVVALFTSLAARPPAAGSAQTFAQQSNPAPFALSKFNLQLRLGTMTTEKPSAETQLIGGSVCSTSVKRMLTFQPFPVPSHFRPFYAVFIVLQGLVAVYWGGYTLWADFTGDHSSDRRMSHIHLLLSTVILTIWMTLSLLHPTRRWLTVILAALLAMTLFLQMRTAVVN